MIYKLDNTLKYGKQHGGFGIQILYPGLIKPELNDTGFSTIGRIDQACITPGTLIPMHPHQNDEILTYLRSGKVLHKDSEGHSNIISNRKLMMMNAGSQFYHEEKTLEEGGVLEGLQIFIRPEIRGLKPQVQFHQLSEAISINQWRKIAGKGNDYPLQIRSNTWILDMQLQQGEETFLPELGIENFSFLFYVFKGDILVNTNVQLSTGESAVVENEHPTFTANETTDIVLFITQKDATYFEGGMYSGNLHN